MKSIILEKVRGRDLPQEWAKQAEVRPEDTVEVAIQPPRNERRHQLLKLMDRVGEEAEQRGLTDEILAELLTDD
jgi:hypothetical protein